MKTSLRIALITIAVISVAALSLVLYVLFGDLSVHRDRVLAAASDASGFYIASEGSFDLEIGGETSLTIDDVIVGNPAWPDEHPLASLGSLQITVDTWSLIAGPPEILSLAVADARVNLKQAGDGPANWIPAAGQVPDTESGEPSPPPVLKKITLDNVNVGYEVAGQTLFIVNELILHADRNAQDDYSLDVAVQFGAPALENTLIARGSARFGSAVDTSKSVQVVLDDAVFEQTGASELKARLSGDLVAYLADDKPRIHTNVDVAQLYFEAGEPPETDADSDEAAGKLFSTTPLGYTWFNDVDLQAGITTGVAVVDGEVFRDVDIAATIESGALHVDPASMALGEGSVSGSLHLAPSGDGYALDVSASVSNLRLAQLAAEGQARDTVPPLNLELALQGTGQSLHDIMASSNGHLTGRQGAGQLDLQAAGALFADMLTSVVRTLNPLAEERTYADVECGILDIDIAAGTADIEELALQSDRLTIVGSGKVDFSDESIDLAVNTKSREGLGLSVGGVANSFVKIGGTLREPALGVDAAGTVTTTGAFVATGGLSVLAKGLWDRLSSEADLCSLPDDATEMPPD
ncbi:MAG: AsmA-like C-terminal region-containing protein [Woeseiaceae bacterium]|nr:AsmA-like C-terminal region-containing protein [Woeseiaceae bacterium]